ncbi:DNA polymerase III subunit beta [Cytobacillus purgationiresistens]|uniref:Beta sliding clamp n=1 Tax=Cytobacillus purgationiresistens TaxID=863449 RepID=A0ABU0ARS6_9BACI|nr:DNA polymerase III subunit beta [Cytobacillus purgationiresistens]MDQ0273502.1 DNA polymerase-3 subunit beta [Cytobacillus purgationiresistens]
MNFTISSKSLDKVNKKIEKVLKAKSALSIYENVLVRAEEQAVYFTVSDGNESIVHRLLAVENELTVKSIGAAVLSQECLSLMKNLKGDISLEVMEKVVKVTQQKTEVTFAVLDAEDFPMIQQEKNTKAITLSGKEFENIVKKTNISASDKDSRPILTGIHMFFSEHGNVFTSTDSHRLSQIKQGSFGEELTIVVPAKILSNMVSVFDLDESVMIFPSDNQIIFFNGNTFYYTRKLEGTYPKVDQLIPQEFSSNLVVDKEEFYQAVDLISMLGGKEKAFLLKINGLFLKVSAGAETSKGNKEIAFDTYDGPENLEVKLSGKFVCSAIKEMDSKKILIGFNGPEKPVVIRPMSENNTEIQLVLPIRIK